MTRKDYILIAEALHSARSIADGEDQVRGVDNASAIVADRLSNDNPNFDRWHFLAVVRGEKSLTSRPGRKS